MARKQVGKICRTRQFRIYWRQRAIARSVQIFERNQSIESKAARGTALAWQVADSASWECRAGPGISKGSGGDARHPKDLTKKNNNKQQHTNAVGVAGRRYVADQGPRQYRG